MLRRTCSVVLLAALGSWGLASPGWADSSSPASSHLGSTWDAPARQVRVQDPAAVSATVKTATVVTSTADPRCDLYTTTFTLRWVARGGHRLTAVVTQYDDFSSIWRALDSTTYTMSPDGVVLDEQAPVVQRWFLRGTHLTSAACPRDTRTTNHVEIYVDGPPRGHQPASIVKPPSRDHLAVIWSFPLSVRTFAPARVTVSTSVYEEIEAPVGPCEAHFTEVDLTFQAVGNARIIAVGLRRPGEPVIYQNGDSDQFGLGVGSHQYFLTGTSQRSSLCPPDQLSQDRIEIYTDAVSHGHS